MRGGAFLKGKEGRVGFRKKSSLMVKKDGMILEKRLDDFRNQNPFSIRKDFQSPSTLHALYLSPRALHAL